MESDVNGIKLTNPSVHLSFLYFGSKPRSIASLSPPHSQGRSLHPDIDVWRVTPRFLTRLLLGLMMWTRIDASAARIFAAHGENMTPCVLTCLPGAANPSHRLNAIIVYDFDLRYCCFSYTGNGLCRLHRVYSQWV